MNTKLIKLLLVFLVLTLTLPVLAKERITNEMIYEKLLQIEKRQAILETKFEEFKYYVDKRFEQVDKRFEELREILKKEGLL